MKQRDWKIIYTSYEGVAKRAIHLLNKEVGKLLIREPNVYRIYVLPCEKEGCEVSKNAFFIGLWNESPFIQSCLSSDEIPQNGFMVKVIPNPQDPDGRFVILTAHTQLELFYAVVSFLDDYIPSHAPFGGCNPMPDLIFDSPLQECTYTEIPENTRRSIFTWGHSINDYRAYIDNMARLKLNELIIWNDHVPLNITDVIDYAHSYGIQILLGYSWGWIPGCSKVSDISAARLTQLKESILQQYEDHYASTGCDGIYFQSFTERSDSTIGGRLIAEAVTTLVNNTADELLARHPHLRLQFGLHAVSVKDRLDEIAKVDPRVEILWEDCGQFPYSYFSYVETEEKFQETLAFTKKLLNLRGGVGVGLVFKGVMMLDWSKFEHQRGPYILGENAPELRLHDKAVRANAWRKYSADWMQSGAHALRMMQFIQENKISDVNLCLAGTFDGGTYLPMALLAQMVRTSGGIYTDMLKQVAARSSITVD